MPVDSLTIHTKIVKLDITFSVGEGGSNSPMRDDLTFNHLDSTFRGDFMFGCGHDHCIPSGMGGAM